MKAKNIEVGEWVWCKIDKQLVKISHIDIDGMVYARGHNLNIFNCPPSDFRYPHISDLQVGDVFKYNNKKYRKDSEADYWCFDDQKTVGFVLSAKVRIISLAEEKPKANRDALGDLKDVERMVPIEPAKEKPEPRSGTIDGVFFNIYSRGKPSRHNSRVGADNFADSTTKERIACVRASIPWSEGQFDE